MAEAEERLLGRDADYFLELQTQTGWGQTLEAFAAWCAPQPGWRALDVGCGPGLLPALLEGYGCRAVGVDLDAAMFHPPRLHRRLAQADALHLPFAGGAFDLVLASNLLFLLEEPAAALSEMRRVLRPGGQVATLNPSERLSLETATALAEKRGLTGLSRQTLLNWASRAEANRRWTEGEMADLFRLAGLRLEETTLKVGPGLARFCRAVLEQ